jgi:fimbrial chaperone protein
MMSTTVFSNLLLRWWFAGVMGLATCAVAGHATAGTFGISPLRVQLDQKHRIGVVTIHNDEDTPLFLQAQMVAWTQKDNEDKTADASDLLVTPPVMQLAPKADQIIRVAIRHVDLKDAELQYRLILTEIPPPRKEGETGLSVALRLSIPVFITPASATHANVHWSAQWIDADQLRIEAYNDGNAHLQVTDFDIAFGNSQKLRVNPSRYILPGSRISWTVKPTQVDRTVAMSIHGFSDEGEFNAVVEHVEAHVDHK